MLSSVVRAVGVLVFVAVSLLGGACSGPSSGEAPIRLVDVFTEETVTGGVASAATPPRTEWRFDGLPPQGAEPEETHGWTIISGATALSIKDQLLTGRTTSDLPILHFQRTSGLDSRDQLHSIEVRMRASAGTNLWIETSGREEFDPVKEEGYLKVFNWEITTPIMPGDERRTYTQKKPRPLPASRIRHLFIRPTDAADARFAIESVRLIFREEYLAGIESGVSFQGMSEIYRESVVARAPETIEISVRLPSRPWLDLALGTVDELPVTFRVTASTGGSSAPEILLEQTLTTPYRWEQRAIDLSSLAGRSVSLSLSLSSEREGAIGVWGSPVIRQRNARPTLTAERARGLEDAVPRGVILLWADTLRRDHLDVYGYERQTAPFLRSMAAKGILFNDSISQASWTKVATPAIMTSLYPSTSGVRDFPDHLPASAVTLAELYREAGYATVSFASNLFTGQFTNLHQGFEVVHESLSLDDSRSSKTAREYVDRLNEWLKLHGDAPFFVFLHLYDPHDPFEPARPYDTLWADSAKKEEHAEQAEKVKEFIKDPMAKAFGMASRDELSAAGIDPEAFVGHDRDWYDGSIRGMDVEIGRLLERLKGLGLAETTLVVFTADHGEEFLDHGRMFHGHTVYGELVQVPLIMTWPGGIPAGVTVEETVQTIDVMPTLLALSGLRQPEGLQGASLVPLIAAGSTEPWQARPAFSEKALTQPGSGGPWPPDTESYSIVNQGWKLIHNVARRDGTPEYELFQVATDPHDQSDVAAEHPEVVARLAAAIDAWHESAVAARLPSDSEAVEGLSQEELERLRSLGYIQ